MRHHLITSIVVLSTIFGLTGCGEQVAVKDAGVFDDFGLSIDGKPVEASNKGILLASLQKVLDEQKEKDFKDINLNNINLKNPNDLKRLDNFFKKIETGTTTGMVPQIFQGLEGIATIMAFKTIALNANVKIKGKIRGYVFDRAKRNGHLSVDMRIDYFDGSIPNDLIKTEILHWDIKVNDNTYKVIPREDNNFDDPFPGTIALPAPKKDPSNPDSIWARGLDHKLFAKGTNIEVLHVYRTIDDGPIERLDSVDYASYYESTTESCIDIMFAGYPPAIVLPPQIGYCLGRCKHPYIINSN